MFLKMIFENLILQVNFLEFFFGNFSLLHEGQIFSMPIKDN